MIVDRVLRSMPCSNESVTRGEDILPVLRKDLHHVGREDHGTHCSVGLWGTDDEFSAGGCDLFVDAKFSGLEVQIVPCECQKLTTAQSCGQLQKEEFVHSFLFSMHKKPM